MASIRHLLMAGIATLLVASACTTISAPPSIPPINIPSLPPINIPTLPPGRTLPPINIPSLPPINIPSLPPINIPSINIPDFSFPPIQLPSGDATAGLCPLVTPAEMSQIVGAEVSVTSDDPNSCTYTLPSFATVLLTKTSDVDLSGVQFLMGDTAQPQTIGGFPGVAGRNPRSACCLRSEGLGAASGPWRSDRQRPCERGPDGPGRHHGGRSPAVTSIEQRLKDAGELQDLLGEPASFSLCLYQRGGDVRADAFGSHLVNVRGVSVVEHENVEQSRPRPPRSAGRCPPQLGSPPSDAHHAAPPGHGAPRRRRSG